MFRRAHASTKPIDMFADSVPTILPVPTTAPTTSPRAATTEPTPSPITYVAIGVSLADGSILVSASKNIPNSRIFPQGEFPHEILEVFYATVPYTYMRDELHTRIVSPNTSSNPNSAIMGLRKEFIPQIFPVLSSIVEEWGAAHNDVALIKKWDESLHNTQVDLVNLPKCVNWIISGRSRPVLLSHGT